MVFKSRAIVSLETKKRMRGEKKNENMYKNNNSNREG